MISDVPLESIMPLWPYLNLWVYSLIISALIGAIIIVLKFQHSHLAGAQYGVLFLLAAIFVKILQYLFDAPAPSSTSTEKADSIVNPEIFSSWHFDAISMTLIMIGFAIIVLRLSGQIRELSKQKDNMNAIFDNAPAELYLKDIEGRYLQINRRFEELFNVKNEDLVGKLPRDAHAQTDPELAASSRAHDLQVLRTGEVHIREEGAIINSCPRVLHTIKFPIFNRKGNITGLGAVVSDVTDLKNAEETLRIALCEAEAANKTKSSFLASMSHEIRTPMSGVIGMTDLILSTDLSPQQIEWVSNIKKSGSNLLTILNEILDQSKLEAGMLGISPVDFHLPTLVHDTVELFSPMIQEKGLVLNININDTLPKNIHADSLRIGQILSNFLSNALKFTETGSIDVHVDYIPLDGRQRDGRQRDDGGFMLRIGVTDSGIGLSDTEMDILFSSFTQADSSTSRKYGGTGLGLSISKQLAEVLGGDVGVESTEGKGSTFWLTALCHPAHGKVAVTDKQSSLDQWQASRSLKILVVEDNNINQQLVKAIMNRLSHDVTIAENGKIATELVASNEYDVVLMDIRMPIMDGMEATRIIRSHETGNSKIPIIAVTADISAGNIETYMNSGMNAVCGKPLNLPVVFRIINELLGEDIHTSA